MSKSILVMDTPKSCEECDIRTTDDYADWCPHKKAKTHIYDYIQNNTKPDWCPLKPVPDRINLRQYVDNTACNLDNIVAYQYAQGWNGFRDKILEEKE